MGAGPAAAATAGRRRLCRQPAAALSAAGKGRRAPRPPEEAAEDHDEGERGAAALPPAPPPRPAVCAPALALPLPPPGPAGLRGPSLGPRPPPAPAGVPLPRRPERAARINKQTPAAMDTSACGAPRLCNEKLLIKSVLGSRGGAWPGGSLLSVSGRPGRAAGPVTQHRSGRDRGHTGPRAGHYGDTAPLPAPLLPASIFNPKRTRARLRLVDLGLGFAFASFPQTWVLHSEQDLYPGFNSKCQLRCLFLPYTSLALLQLWGLFFLFSCLE